ncbi:MAG: hypothetical protein PHG89_09180 [Gallionella sp.]|nr:hypothetical protein [Gallionella sp.]
MRKVHLVVCDLFLPADIAAGVCADLRLPALEKMLARGASAGAAPSTGSGRAGDVGASLENYLCELFGVPCQPNGYGKYATPDNEARHARFPDGTTSHSTRLPKDGNQVAGYHPNLPPLAGEGANETLREFHVNAPIAPVSAAFDGLGEGCWLRADPVHLRLQRDQLVLLPDVEVGAGEAAQLCVALNEYFVGQGMEFFTPHPQRWYVRVDRLPDIETVSLMQAAGCNVRGLLPKGAEAASWHRIFNEIQMLLFAHPVNEAREARGELPVNSLWLWGGGCDTLLAKPADCGSSRQAALPALEGSASPCQGGGMNLPPRKTYDCVSSDEVLVEMFAAAAGIPFAGWAGQWRESLQGRVSDPPLRSHMGIGCSSEGRQLLVWTGLHSALRRGDLDAWRAALQEFETGYAQPLWQALRIGEISQLQVDILGGNRVRHLLLTRADAWAFWRRAKPLAQYSMV